MIEEEIAPVDEAPSEPEMPNPVIILTEAQVHATMLAEAGATYDIRYAGKRAADMVGRLLGHMERHRRIVGTPAA